MNTDSADSCYHLLGKRPIFHIAAVERKIGKKHMDIFICGEDGSVSTAWWTEGCPRSTMEEAGGISEVRAREAISSHQALRLFVLRRLVFADCQMRSEVA